MDVKTEENFKEFYKSRYTNVINWYYKKLKKDKNTILISKILVGSLLIIIPFIIIEVFANKITTFTSYRYIFLIYSIFIFGLVSYSIISNLKRFMYALNEVIIGDILAFISDNDSEDVVYEPETRVSTESLNKIELFNLDVVKYSGKNYIRVPYNNRNIILSDIDTYIYEESEYERVFIEDGVKYRQKIRHKEKKTIFDGVYIGAPLAKNNSAHIYLIPNNLNDKVIQSKIMDYIKYDGKHVMLENLDFSKKYKFFCDDEIQARYILSLSFMEKINELDKLFTGKKYIVFKEGKRFVICIEGVKIENIRKNILPIFRNKIKEEKVLVKVFNELNSFFAIYHVLDLGNSVYVV